MLKKRNKPAIHARGQCIGYDELLQQITCYAEKFGEFTQRDKIIIFAENSVEWISALYGAWRAGSIVIPVDVVSTFEELSYMLADAQPDLIFCDSSKKELAALAVSALGLDIPLLSKEDIDLKDVHQKPVEDFTPEDPGKTAVIVYTSGTTGSSKGVMHSFTALNFVINAVREVDIYTESTNTMVLLPVFHIYPLIGTVLAPLASGGTIHLAESLASESIMQTLNSGKINIVIGVPRLFDALAKGVLAKINEKTISRIMYKLAAKLQWRGFSKVLFGAVHKKFGGHIHYFVSGGAALSIETGRIFKILGFYMLEGFGMAETSGMACFTRPGEWKLGYAGKPMKGVDVKIEAGEICFRGDNIMQGYYNRPEETAAIIKNGWLHTGDFGQLEKYGIKFTGRKKEIIVTSNGKNINPVELETAFCQSSPYLKEVGLFLHEEIIQAVILPDMEQIRGKSIQELPDLIKASVLDFNEKISPYKHIKRFHIVSEELPKNRLGKLQRFKLSAIITKPEIEKNTENKEYGEHYRLVKRFVEKETGLVAGEHDHFEIDLAMDSLSRVALYAYVETTFGVTFTESLMHELNTLYKLNEYIKECSFVAGDRKEMQWKDILTAKLSDITLPESGITNKILMFCSRYLLKILYRYKSRGLSNIPDEACIMVANHQSMLDGVLVTATLKRYVNKNTYIFAKEKHWKSPIMSLMAGKNNVILMDVNTNLREALQKLSYVLKNGKNVIIFPEGTRSKTGIRDFKDTFTILSKELNVPIVPIAIHGTDKAVYKSVKLPRCNTPISIDFMESIYPRQEETYHDLKTKVKNVIAEKVNHYLEKREQRISGNFMKVFFRRFLLLKG